MISALKSAFWAFVFAFIGVAAAAVWVGSGLISQEAAWRAEAIERGHALHCPSTGNFAWIGECDE